MSIDRLSTPCLLVENRRLESNLERMQQRATREGVALRPHVKTHKSIDIARRQLALGAHGITVAKVGEAEVFAAAGITDLRIAYPLIGDDKYQRVLTLADRARVSFCVDSAEGAGMASSFFAQRGLAAEVLLKVDCGYGRAGVRWDSDRALPLARTIDRSPGLDLIGVLTHAGQSYAGPEPGEEPVAALRRHAVDERERTLELVERLVDDGLCQSDRFEVSIGSTPTLSAFQNRDGGDDALRITEVRPGNYAFYDRTQVSLGAASLEDCALTVLMTVVSRREDPDGRVRILLDGGRKTLTSDLDRGGSAGTAGYGALIADRATMTQIPDAEIYSLSEEHAWARVGGEHDLQIGDRVTVLPNHACTAVSTQDHVYLVDGDEVVGRLRVDARGRVT